MSKKKEATRQQIINHNVSAFCQLHSALKSVEAIEELCGRCAANEKVKSGLIRDVIVLYVSVFKLARLANEGKPPERALSRELVSDGFKDLHDRLVCYRDVWVAHPDICPRQPKRRKVEGKPAEYDVREKSPLEFEDDLPQIKELIRGVIVEMKKMGLRNSNEA
jgi:hypothetical protein